jgi:hypothetical protein
MRALSTKEQKTWTKSKNAGKDTVIYSDHFR